MTGFGGLPGGRPRKDTHKLRDQWLKARVTADEKHRVEQLARDAVHLFARPSVTRARELTPRAVAWRPQVVVSEVAEFAGREVAAACGLGRRTPEDAEANLRRVAELAT